MSRTILVYLFAAMICCLGCARDESVDRTDLMGEWQGHAENIDERNVALGADEMVRETVLSLREDGSYEWNTGGTKKTGSWSLSDGILRLVSGSTRGPGPRQPTVVVDLRVEGRRLVTVDPRGADTNEKFWFERQ
jgi:hypothetical protein